MTDESTKHGALYWIEKGLAMLTNVVVIFGIYFGFAQLRAAKQSEKIQNAINAINQTRSSDFLKAYARVKTATQTKHADDQVSLIDDLNYVMNTYDNAALLYIKDRADKCMIKEATFSSVQELPAICETLSYPEGYRANLNEFLRQMTAERCD